MSSQAQSARLQCTFCAWVALSSRVLCLPASSLSQSRGPCARRPLLYNHRSNVEGPHSCARARTVASEVFTEAQSFADCKLHIRTRLLASAFSNFWKTP
ncbi:hypothetical protein C8Q73DRAFT_698086, partial [Cubamyces lactineus]